MNLYAVRQINNVPIGLFLADDTGQLAAMVDPRTEPARCEYRMINVPTCITFDHPSHEVAWGMGIKEKDCPDSTEDFGEWEGWFLDRIETIQMSINFDNDATANEEGTLADILHGEKDTTGWHRFSVHDLKVRNKFWGLEFGKEKPREQGA